MSCQLTLLPGRGPELRRKTLPLEAIDGFADASPSSKLRELIRDLGLLQPIVVVPVGAGRFRLVEGRRRCKAIAQLAEAGEWPAPPHLDALVIDTPEATRHEVQGGLTLALHATRSASPASELHAIESILAAGDAGDQVTEIAAQTGITVQTVRRRLRLRSLTPRLRSAFEQGRITASVAEACARLPHDQQAELERRLDDDLRVSIEAVHEVARNQARTAIAELPHGLFADPMVAWQATVRGHLAAALQAIPPGENHKAVRRAVTAALAAVEAP